MKKLMTMIATVAMAFGLYADGLKNTVGFENGAYTAGSKIDVTKGDNGETTQAPVWSATDPTETGTVTEYGTDTKYDYGTQPVIVTDGPGNQFLALETAGLFRNITAGGTASGLANGDVFFDTLVKLSATDGLSVPELSNDAKIAIWAGTDEDNNPGVTNLYVTAAADATGEAKPEAANFTISVGDDFDFDAWHRITVRSLVANTDDAKVAGFVVFVDGVQVACSDEDYADKLGEGLTLTTEAAKFAAQKQLFIGLVYGKDATMLTALGFSGTGAADDVAITDAANAPQFAKGEKVFTLTWDKDAFVSITAGGVDQTVEDGKADITLDGSTTELAVSGVVKTGYKLIGLTAKEGCTADNENGKFTGIVGAAAGSIDAKKVYFTVNGVDCTTLTEAFTEAAKTAGSTITLAGDYSVEKEEQTIAEGADIILDLAGNNMEFTALENEGDVFDVAFGGKLTIIDSVGGGEISIDGEEDAEDIVIAYAEGTLVIGGDTDKGATFTGKLCAPETQDLTIIGGNFDKVNNGVKAFDYTIDTDKYEAVDTVKTGYWTVQEKQAKNFIIEIVGGDKYESIADALAAAENDDTLKLLKDVALDDTLVVNKAITLDLDNCVITLAADKAIGIDIKVDGVTITNGEIDSALTANVAYSKAINIPNKNVTLNDVEINAGHYEYAIYANCDDDCKAAGDKLEWFYDDITRAKFATLNCELVNINGNGSLFHIEGMTANLTSCVAAYDNNPLFANEAHRAAVYSAVNALTTISGAGSYTHVNALQSGNLGGQIKVAADSTAEFTGDIKSFMKVGAHPELEETTGYTALFSLLGGIYDGEIVFVDDDARNLDLFIKGNDVTLNPPEGYKWNEGVLTKIEYATLTITSGENVTAVVVTNAAGEVVTDGAKFDKDDAVVVAVDLSKTTFAENYELDAAESTLTVTLSADDEIIVKAKEKQGGWDPTVDPTLPASDKGITGKLANASFKDLSTWAQTYSVDFAAGNMDKYADAFLLDCDPEEVETEKKNFKFKSITQDAEGNWIVLINDGEIRGDQQFYGNGIATITRYSDVECTTPADDGNFFKASLEVYSVATPK